MNTEYVLVSASNSRNA